MKNLQINTNRFILEKFIQYGLHIGSLKSIWNPNFKPFLKGIRNNFCILNPSLTLLYLRRSLKILLKTHLSNKKILFIGAPVGLEKAFSLLCAKHKHYFLETVPYGFFTNYKNKIYPGFTKPVIIDERPHLIFIFDPSLNSYVFNEIKALDVPVVAFVSSEDDYTRIDYPIPANVRSQKGGLFAYNLFYYLFLNKDLKVLNKKKKIQK